MNKLKSCCAKSWAATKKCAGKVKRNKTWIAAELNLRNIKIVYWLVGGVAFFLLILNLINLIGVRSGTYRYYGAEFISLGFPLISLPAFAAVFMATRNFKRTVNIGGKRANHYWGSIMALVILCAAATLLNSFMYYVVERNLVKLDSIGYTTNWIEMFDWDFVKNAGVVIILQFSLLFFTSSIAFFFASIQDRWYGWVTDAAIVAILITYWLIDLLVSRPPRIEPIYYDYPILLEAFFLTVFGMLFLAISRLVFTRKSL
ncbi:MAG: hypothetical protein FWE62_05185 [Firmicutes bacterium]|nr:hypothetical protein [Bacillota bacterium]